MKHILYLTLIFLTGCGLFGMQIYSEPVSLSMMQEHELRNEMTWVVCRGHNHKKYFNERIKRELIRRKALKRCEERGFVVWTPDLYERSEEEEAYFKN